MQFKEVVGQEELKGKFKTLIKANHLPHAIMLHEAEGSGGMAMARAAVQYLMCENRTDTDSCGQCASCNKVSKLQHPDVHFSFPFNRDQKKKPICSEFYQDFRRFILDHPYASESEWFYSQSQDKQGNIPAEECRDILRKLQMRPYENGYKIMIIWKPEYLGKEGNILLKFIEEPTPKTILILVTESMDKVLSTIQSRSQLFSLKRLMVDDICSELLRRDIPSDQANQIARLADGNFRKAELLVGQTQIDFTEMAYRWFEAILHNKGLEIYHNAMELAKEGKETQKNSLGYFTQLLEHSIRYQQLGKEHVTLMPSEISLIEKLLSGGVSLYRIQQIADILNEAIYHLERNANSKILFHSVSLRVQQLILAKKVA